MVIVVLTSHFQSSVHIFPLIHTRTHTHIQIIVVISRILSRTSFMSPPYFSSPHIVLKQQWPFTYTNLKKNPPSMAQVPSSRCLSLSNVSLAILAEPLSHAKWLLVKMGLEGEQKQNEPSMARLLPFFTGKWHAQLKKPPGSHCLVTHFVCLSSSVSGWLWQAPTPCKASHDPWTLVAL